MPTPEHYAGKNTIAKQEVLAHLLVSRGVAPSVAFCAATAVKYLDRAGDKDGESSECDLSKAADYLFRAIVGAWPWELSDEAGEEGR